MPRIWLASPPASGRVDRPKMHPLRNELYESQQSRRREDTRPNNRPRLGAHHRVDELGYQRAHQIRVRCSSCSDRRRAGSTRCAVRAGVGDAVEDRGDLGLQGCCRWRPGTVSIVPAVVSSLYCLPQHGVGPNLSGGE